MRVVDLSFIYLFLVWFFSSYLLRYGFVVCLCHFSVYYYYYHYYHDYYHYLIGYHMSIYYLMV